MLASFGVAEQAIQVETNSLTIVDAALNSRSVIESKHLRRVLLVTTALQMPRAVGVFRQQYPDLTIIPAPTAYLFPEKAAQSWRAAVERCIPSADHLLMSEQIVREYTELLYCRIRGQWVGW